MYFVSADDDSDDHFLFSDESEDPPTTGYTENYYDNENRPYFGYTPADGFTDQSVD